MVVTLDRSLYSAEAVAAAVEAFASHSAITTDATDTSFLRINIDGDARTVDEFLNYALIASLEVHLANL